VFAAAVGGAIAGGTLGLASGAGIGVTMLAGAGGNVLGGTAERGIAEGDADKAFDGKQMLKDAAWGAGAGALSKAGAEIGERIGGSKQLEAVTEKAQQTKLGARHADRLTRQANALSSSVRAGEKMGEQLAHHATEAVQKNAEQAKPSQQPKNKLDQIRKPQ
jgi:hypothetical protein